MRVIIKREIFYAIQHGGRIDPKTGRLSKVDVTKNVTNDVIDDVIEILSERQRVILKLLPLNDKMDVTETTFTLAQKQGCQDRLLRVLRVSLNFAQTVFVLICIGV